MELEIQSGNAYEPMKDRSLRSAKSESQDKSQENRIAQEQIQKKLETQLKESLASAENVDAERYLKQILKFTKIYNKKLKYSIHEETQQVIVKVIDSETDKVIKEIPSEELQRLYSNMKEAIGLLVDEQR